MMRSSGDTSQVKFQAFSRRPLHFEGITGTGDISKIVSLWPHCEKGSIINENCETKSWNKTRRARSVTKFQFE